LTNKHVKTDTKMNTQQNTNTQTNAPVETGTEVKQESNTMRVGGVVVEKLGTTKPH